MPRCCCCRCWCCADQILHLWLALHGAWTVGSSAQAALLHLHLTLSEGGTLGLKLWAQSMHQRSLSKQVGWAALGGVVSSWVAQLGC